MKQYEAKQLAAISRYQNYIPTLPPEIRQELYARMGELIEEEKAYCDKGNYKHMAQILTSIALYEVLQRHGQSEEEAYRIVSGEMWKFLDPSGMQKLARKRFFLPLMKKIVPFGFKKGSGAGWRYTWHEDDPKNEFHFECNECLYAKILGRRGLLKLGAMCCHADVINYGNLPYEEMYRRIHAAIQGKRTLELCTGTGLIARHVADTASEMVATDFAEKMLAEARKGELPDNLSFQQADATALPFADDSFDAVIISNALHIIPNPEQALAEIRRVLRPDGVLIAPNFVHREGDLQTGVWSKLLTAAGIVFAVEWDADSYRNSTVCGRLHTDDGAGRGAGLTHCCYIVSCDEVDLRAVKYRIEICTTGEGHV